MARPRLQPVYENGPVRVTPRGERFRLRWMEHGEERERSVATLEEATDLADELADRLALTSGGAVSGAAAFGALGEAWVKTYRKEWSAGHTANVHAILAGHVNPTLGAKACDRITDADLLGVLRGMDAQGYSADWVASATRTIRALCKWGVHRGVWAPHRNPGANLKAPTPSLLVDRKLIPSAASVRALRDAVAELAPNREQALRREWLLIAAAGCGMRWGEAVAITPESVDLAKREVRIRQTWHEHGPHTLGQPKSEASVRTVVIPEADVALWRTVVEMTGEGEYLGQTLRGRVWRNSNWNRVVMRPAAELVPSWPAGARFHSLRHHAIVTWLDAGVPPGDVAALAGHHKASFTMDRYVGPRDDHLERAKGLL